MTTEDLRTAMERMRRLGVPVDYFVARARLVFRGSTSGSNLSESAAREHDRNGPTEPNGT